jgi:rubrerythrin
LKVCDCDPSDAGFFIYCQLSSVSCDDAGNRLDAESIVEFVSCNGITGRRPLGLHPPRIPRRAPLGDYFAANAHLESASVRAFRDLAGWLAAFGAPPRLARLARRSAEEERGHARAAARLARRFGGMTARPRTRRVPSPTLVELLEDDAVEGCVKETFGALLATWQAAHASDRGVRRTMRRIALDETRHAALAWEILEWGLTRLSAEERRRLDKTLDRALVALESSEPVAVHSSLQEVAGHPASEHERRLARELARLVREERVGCRHVVMRQRPWSGAALG